MKKSEQYIIIERGKRMSLQDYKGVLVFAQQLDCQVTGVSFELIGKGKELATELGTEVTAVVLGSGVQALADQLAAYGADRVLVVDDPALAEYTTEPYTHAICTVIEQYKPEVVLLVLQQSAVTLLLVYQQE